MTYFSWYVSANFVDSLTGKFHTRLTVVIARSLWLEKWLPRIRLSKRPSMLPSQANEKANEALANEEYNHLHDTLAKCSVRSKYKYAAHSFKRTWRCQAICFEKVFLYKLTSVFFASTDFLVQFCYKALFRHWNYLLSLFAAGMARMDLNKWTNYYGVMLLTNSTRAFSVWVKALKTSDQAFSCFLFF